MGDLKSTYYGKKVFITGHTGFKGAWLTQWLVSLGAQVYGYSIDIPTQPALFESLQLEDEISHKIGDIRDFKTLKNSIEEFQPDFVFHLAAQPLVRLSYDNPVLTFETNVMGTVNLMEAMRHCNSIQAAVLVATDKCYENLETGDAFKESDRLGGADPYSASKACAEVAFHSYQKSFFQHSESLKVASARAGNVIGGGDWALDRIIPDCVRSWSQKEPVVIRSPRAIRPWQHVLEPLRGYLELGAALVWGEFIGESFNFGPEKESTRTVEDLLVGMKEHWADVSWEVQEAEGTKKESQLLMLDCEKAHNELGWKPSLNFQQGLKMTAQWYQSFVHDPNSVKTLTLEQVHSYSANS